MSEAVTPRAKGKFSIVATPSQAAALRAKGATVTAPFGVTKSARGRARACNRRPPHADRTATTCSGPGALTPAPCPGTCSTPLVPSRPGTTSLPRHNPDVRQGRGHRHSRVLGQDIMAYKVTRARSDEARRRRPAVLYNSTQHAREWISTEVEPAAVQVHRRAQAARATRGSRTLLSRRGAVVRPDRQRRRLRLHVPRQGHAPVAQEPARQQRRRPDHGHRRRRHQPQLADEVELRPRGRVRRLRRPRRTTAQARPPSPRCRPCAALEKRIRPSFQIDYHSFAQLILYPEGWQVETPPPTRR